MHFCIFDITLTSVWETLAENYTAPLFKDMFCFFPDLGLQ